VGFQALGLKERLLTGPIQARAKKGYIQDNQRSPIIIQQVVII